MVEVATYVLDMDVTATSGLSASVQPIGPALAPRSLRSQTKLLVLLAREVNERAVANFIRSCDEGWDHEQHVEAKREVARTADALAEVMYLAQIVKDIHPVILDFKHPINSVST